jgi:hypothetical protein
MNITLNSSLIPEKNRAAAATAIAIGNPNPAIQWSDSSNPNCVLSLEPNYLYPMRLTEQQREPYEFATLRIFERKLRIYME